MEVGTQELRTESSINPEYTPPSIELFVPQKIEIVVGSSFESTPTRLLLRNEDINNAEQLGFFSLCQIISHKETLIQQNLDYISMINSSFIELMFQIFENQTTITKALQTDKANRSRDSIDFAIQPQKRKKASSNVNVGYTPQTDPSTLAFKTPKSQSKEGGAFERQWNARFEELKQFKEKFGHVNVTRVTRGYENLGVWLADQRKRFRAGKMTRQRFDLLTDLGVEWDRSYYFKPAMNNQEDGNTSLKSNNNNLSPG
mmetsp:Transcript_27484/g.38764  ORF Transcript_27484/g.38764 Transcript_27484/m.38764 type:complete len:258 (-) Transcript_27484:13-786(-)